MLKTIVKFSAEWCQPCKTFAKVFHNVKEMDEYKDIEFKELDIENDDEGIVLTEKYQVKSVPTTILLDENGEQLFKVIGNAPQNDFIEIINEAIKRGEEKK